VQNVRQGQLQEGAIADPASLRGRVAVVDILPNSQITAADFTTSGVTLASRLIGQQRAITISLDASHAGPLEKGDRVDVYAGFQVQPVDATGRPAGSGQARPVLRLIMQAIPVLKIESDSGGVGGGSQQVTLQTTARKASELAFAADNGSVWLTQRPPTGASVSPANIVTAETLLLGVPPVTALKGFGGRK
jgi:Flp pilus assembly protein CpaB